MRLLEDKVAIVTGGSSGIGLHTVLGLASLGAHVISTCRDEARGADVVERARTANMAPVTSMRLDLERLDDVRRFASEVSTQLGTRPLDIVVHNAGAVYPDRRITPDGIEAQLAVIHAGPLLLTHLLAPSMARAGHASLVHVVSDLHKRARVDPPARFHMISSYAHAELRKVMCAWELQRRLPETIVSCVHPGGVRSRLFRSVRGPFGWLLAVSDLLKMPPSMGARASLHAASQSQERGAYFANNWLGVRDTRAAKITYDDAACARVYEQDCALVGAQPLS